MKSVDSDGLPLSLSLTTRRKRAPPTKLSARQENYNKSAEDEKRKKKKRISSCVNLPLQSNPTLDIVRKVAGIILGCLLARR